MPEVTAGDLGEDALIAAVVARLGRSDPAVVLLGPGDDAAVLATPDGRVVATTDVLVEGVHFRRDWSGGYDVGRKAAAANLADVAAMGARTTALLVGLALPRDVPARWVLALADGLRDEAAVEGAVVVGGDTVAAALLMVSVTALGDLAGRRPVTRAGARPGEVLVVVGRLGASAAGLRLLSRGVSAGPAVQAHRRPTPPYAAGRALAALGATAMCDLSDGLGTDLQRLCTASGVAAELDLAALPIAVGADLSDALHGGEDHGMLATVPRSQVAAAEELGAVAVGQIQAGEGVRDTAGRPLQPTGYRHWG